ncbi:MAG: hypothetical protein KDK62_05090 [Chlamydiia bacterium]|nr:hypothetical protein [Chlamydiia bacterium]
MVNPDSTIKNTDPKGIERAHGTPDRNATEKTKRRLDGVFERKKSKEELAQEWEEVKQEAEKGSGKVKEKPAEKESISLFDLAARKPNKGAPNSTEAKLDRISYEVQEPDQKTGSLFDLASAKPGEKKPKEPTPYIRESPDLSHVNLMATGQPQATENIQTTQAIEPRADQTQLKKIVDEIVKHLYQLEKSGETSVIIVINDPKSPFHKTSIRIQEFDSAKGELNITIDNLKPDAKSIVENQKGVLLDALEQKGYQVQQFIATSQSENPRFNLEASRSGDSDEKGEGKEPQDQGEEEPKEQQ